MTIESKEINYPYLIIKSILNNIEQIISYLNEGNANEVFRYYMKPLIEDYTNLENIIVYKHDYILALIIDGAVRVDRNSGIINVYNEYGEKIIKIKKDKDLEAALNKYYNKIKNERIKKLFRLGNEKLFYRYSATVDSKLRLLSNKRSDTLKQDKMIALYSIVNNYSHSNTYYMLNVNSDYEKSYNKITVLIEDIINRLEEIVPQVARNFTKIVLLPRISVDCKLDLKAPKKKVNDDLYTFNKYGLLELKRKKS